jgi:HEAT repeat protein
MTQRGRTLIVLDNATDWRPVEHLIPTTASVLVTTRTRDFGGTSFRHLELDILSDDSAKSLLVQVVPRLALDESLPKLIAALGGHALALEIAAGTIRTLAISAAEYLARLDTRSPDPTEVLNQVKHGKTVEECLRLTWDTLQRESARLLWRRASLFAPTSAHRDLLRVSFSADSKTRRELEYLLREQSPTPDVEPNDILSDEFDVAYAELRSRNVFSRIEGASGERWAIHRLVRDFGRARIRPLEFLAHSMAVSEWLRAPHLDLLPEIPHVIAIILDSAKFGGEFQSILGRGRNIGRELAHRSVWSSGFLESSEYFLRFIRDELRDPKALTMLLEGLTDVNDDVRKQAIRVLERLPAVPEVIDGIAAALDDPDSGVRSLARRTITESGTATVVNILERTLTSSRPRARVEAVRGLAELGPAGREALETAFAEQTGDVKFEAGLALAELGEDVVLAELIPIAQASADPTVRIRALRAVRFAPSEAVDALYLNAINDPYRAIGVEVLRTLENYPRLEVVKECVTRYLASTLPTLPHDEGVELALSLAARHGVALSEEVGLALSTHDSWTVRQKVAQALASSTASNASKLLSKLLSDSVLRGETSHSFPGSSHSRQAIPVQRSKRPQRKEVAQCKKAAVLAAANWWEVSMNG